jgi:hypothetical protein
MQERHTTSWKKRFATAAGALVSVAGLVGGGATAAGAQPATQSPSPTTLAHAGAIRDDVNGRIRLVAGAGLAVTDASSTDVLESFSLLSDDLLDTRFVLARGGVWYAICPERALCPYPAPWLARPASDHLVRQVALQLVLRTFLETDAPVVGVALPTPQFVALIVEREELARKVDLAAVARALGEQPLLDPTLSAFALAPRAHAEPHPQAALLRLVEELTRPRTYLFIGLEFGPTGGPSWAGMPYWPAPRW